ncbi:SH3 domain-containing protein [Leptospira barantonii]|uniref:SH3 domain-containing protein n=1 Tax=Leptospira barantonii TaxID=2023184 RepID=UPI001FF06A37|nr:SH3 domain-containing protein [Leptospira barantonii]
MKRLFYLFLFLFAFSNSFNAESQERYAKVNANGGLYLRDGAGQKNSSVRLLPSGIRVKIIGRSEKAETLNGKKGNWVEVEGLYKKGWVFDAYLENVSNTDSLVVYQKYLDSLKTGELSSLQKAENQFISKFAPNSPDAENAFRVYTEFVVIQSSEINSKLQEKLQNDYGKWTDSALVRELNSHGLTVEYCEGDAALIEYYDHSLVVLKNHTFPLKETIRLLSKVGYPYTCDAGIGISWEEMRKRIAKIETFLKEFNTVPEKPMIEGLLKEYFGFYVNGLDNTPVCECREESCVLSNEVRKSFKNFLNENKTSVYFSFVEKLNSIYSKNQFRCNEETRKFGYSFFEKN